MMILAELRQFEPSISDHRRIEVKQLCLNRRLLQHRISYLGNRMIDGRSPAGVAIRRWRADLIGDLGGADAVSTQQLAIVDLAGKQKLLLDSIDTWLLSQPSLINARKRSLIPVVLQRQALADSLAKYLAQLGLERRHKVKTLHELLADERNGATDNGVNGNNGAGEGVDGQ